VLTVLPAGWFIILKPLRERSLLYKYTADISLLDTFQIHFVCLFLAQQPPAGQGLLSHEVSWSHTTTLHSR